MRTRIKICGITREEDALAAIRAGADAIGFVFWPQSPRVVSAARAAEIELGVVRTVPIVARVGVFVDAHPDEVAHVVRTAMLDAVQLHGEEQPADYVKCGVPIIKAVRVSTDAEVSRALAIDARFTVLVDAIDPERRGGTGQIVNWELARQVASARPIMLAGGLNPQNVARAIAEVRPWAIDVSSGIEEAPGVKDLDAIAALCRAVGQADREAV